MARQQCFVCGDAVDAEQQLVLARGRVRQVHCSEACVRETLRGQRAARARFRWKAVAVGSLVALLLAGGWKLRRHRAPQARSIAIEWTESVGWERPAPLEPNYFGPNWPPTDADWMFAFERATWLYPLPGPIRRPTTPDNRLFVPEAARGSSGCRDAAVCGVALGGQLWGEHVYAVLEGVVDRASPGGSGERGGGHVRIAHFGGMVFTHYFHLAAIPRGVVRGARISTGEVIGLVGDTGTGAEQSGPRAHLHFALSIRPSLVFPEIFWDPSPMMAKWPLRTPAHGSVAGLVAATNEMETPRRHRGR